MAGVIDDKGTQWEHCNDCGEFVRFSPNCNLGYHKPTKAHPNGRDLCVKCVDKGIRSRKYLFKNIIPAPAWVVVEVEATV